MQIENLSDYFCLLVNIPGTASTCRCHSAIVTCVFALMIDCRSCFVALIGCRSCYPTGYRDILVMSKLTQRDQTNTHLQISLPVPSECSLFLLYKIGVAHCVELCGMAVVLQKQPALKKG